MEVLKSSESLERIADKFATFLDNDFIKALIKSECVEIML